LENSVYKGNVDSDLSIFIHFIYARHIFNKKTQQKGVKARFRKKSFSKKGQRMGTRLFRGSDTPAHNGLRGYDFGFLFHIQALT
jgi:hypothetical protein